MNQEPIVRFINQDDGIIRFLQETVEPYTRNLLILLAVGAAMQLVPAIVIGLPFCGVGFVLCLLTHEKMPFLIFPLALVGGLAFAVGFNAFRCGWTKILLNIVEDREVSFSDLPAALPHLINFTLCCMLVSFATFLAGCFLIVPGVFVAVRTIMAPFLVVDEGLGPIEACMRSNELVSGYSWQILLYQVLLFVANWVAGLIVGWIPILGIVLGLVATVPVLAFFELALARIYRARNPIEQR